MRREDPSREALINEIVRLEARIRDLEAGETREAAMLRLMCDEVPDLIWAHDIHSNYFFANQAMCDHPLQAKETSEPLGLDDLFFALREREAHLEKPEWHTFGEICQDSDRVVLESRKAAKSGEYGNVKGRFLYLDVHKAPF